MTQRAKMTVFECEPNYHCFFDPYKRTAVFKDEVALRAIGGVRQSLSVIMTFH